MRKKMNVKLLSLVLPYMFVCSAPVFAADKTVQDAKGQKPTAEKAKEEKKQLSKEELFSQKNILKLSETCGHMIQKGLENPVLKLDFDAVVKGMQDAKAGKQSPMTEQEYESMMTQLQECAYQDLSERNLKDAERFLKDNAKKDGVKELEPGKLQYLILKDGTGEVVTEELRPTIKYSGQYLDGTVFGSSDSTNGPISISLKQTIPGFRKGVLGMKVGEKRRLFIHPELGYGTSGQLLPNALLIFEIEVTEVKPEPKEPKKVSANDDADDEQYAAENLFPDELDERDDLDMEDGDDTEADDDEDTSEDVAALDSQIERDEVEVQDSELEQNDFQSLSKNKQQQLKKDAETKDRVKQAIENENAKKAAGAKK